MRRRCYCGAPRSGQCGRIGWPSLPLARPLCIWRTRHFEPTRRTATWRCGCSDPIVPAGFWSRWRCWSSAFPHASGGSMLDPERARSLAQRLVERAVTAGATSADAVYLGSASSSVEVRLGELESVSRSEGEDLGLRIFLGQRSATVSSSDLAEDSFTVLVERCLAMARQAPEDPYAGLAPTSLLQRGTPPEVDGADVAELDPAQLKARALEAESAALAVAGITNSSGASAGTSATTLALATSGRFA